MDSHDWIGATEDDFYASLKNGCDEFTGEIVVTFTVEDDCKLNSATTAVFRVIDDRAPYLYMPDDVDIYFDDKCQADTDPCKHRNIERKI